MYEDRTYAIVDLVTWNAALATSGQSLDSFYEMILETAPETLRYSVAEDEFVIKTDNADDLAALTGFAETYSVEYILYNHADCVALMATLAWTTPLEV